MCNSSRLLIATVDTKKKESDCFPLVLFFLCVSIFSSFYADQIEYGMAFKAAGISEYQRTKADRIYCIAELFQLVGLQCLKDSFFLSVSRVTRARGEEEDEGRSVGRAGDALYRPASRWAFQVLLLISP